MDYGRMMADEIGTGRAPSRVLSLATVPSLTTVVHRLPATSAPSAAKPGGRAGYAIELPAQSDRCTALRWGVVEDRHVIESDMVAPLYTLQVTAGFIYRCGTAIDATLRRPDQLDQFGSLRDTISSACAGWSVGLLVCDDQDTGDEEGFRSIYGLSRSNFVDANGTPPHLFELTFSYVGHDDEVRSQSAYGSDALTSPVAAVARLVRSLRQQGQSLNPGDIVFSGGVTTPVPVVPGGTYRAVSSSLGIATDFGVEPRHAP